MLVYRVGPPSDKAATPPPFQDRPTSARSVRSTASSYRSASLGASGAARRVQRHSSGAHASSSGHRQARSSAHYQTRSSATVTTSAAAANGGGGDDVVLDEYQTRAQMKSRGHGGGGGGHHHHHHSKHHHSKHHHNGGGGGDAQYEQREVVYTEQRQEAVDRQGATQAVSVAESILQQGVDERTVLRMYEEVRSRASPRVGCMATHAQPLTSCMALSIIIIIRFK